MQAADVSLCLAPCCQLAAWLLPGRWAESRGTGADGGGVEWSGGGVTTQGTNPLAVLLQPLLVDVGGFTQLEVM